MTVEAAQRELPADPSDAPVDVAGQRSWLTWAQQAAVVVALVIWARVVTGRAGGRDDGALLIGCVSVLPALLLLRPTLRSLAPLFVLVGAALAVCLMTPFGFSSPQVVGEAAYTGAAFAIVLSFATTIDRRLAVAAALCLVSLDQFAQGFLAWWGNENPDRPMIGTFYWHNQYAAFLLPGVMIGSALAVFGHRVLRLVGLISAPVCLAGVIYSSSRASMIIAAGGVLAVLVLAAVASDRRRVLPVAAGLVALAAGVALFFTSSVFFQQEQGGAPAANNPLGATLERAEQQSLGRNTGYRLDFWQAAAAEFAERPLAGGGFGSFRELSGVHLPPAAVRAASAHNEFLHALAEGGLLWGLPVIGLTAAACFAALRRLRGRLLAPAPDRAVAVGSVLALGALVAHAGVDFDWAYPSLAVSFGVAAALVLAIPRERAPRDSSDQFRSAGAVVACLGLVLGAQIAQAHEASSRQIGGFRQVLEQTGASAAADAVLKTRTWYADPRIDAALLEIGLSAGIGQPLALPEPLLREAVAATRDYAKVNDSVNAQRAGVLVALGSPAEGLRAVREMAEQRAHSRPATLAAYAGLLDVTGSSTEARQLLAGTVLLRAEEALGNPGLGAQLYTLYRELRRIAPASLDLRCAGSALVPLNIPLKSTAAPLARTTPSDSCAFLREKGWP